MRNNVVDEADRIAKFEAACLEIEKHVGSSTSILKKKPELICYETMRSWMSKDAALAVRYARAKAEQVESFVEHTLDAIFTPQPDDFMSDKDGNLIANPVTIAKNREKKDIMKWYAGKLKPKKYGDLMPQNTDEKPISPISMSIPARKQKPE